MKLLLRGVFVFGHPSRNESRKQGLTLLSGRHVFLSLWYSESERNCLLISKMRKGNKERKISDIGWENKEQKNERSENENYYLLW